MIRRAAHGRYFCDGRECGYPLTWADLDPEDGAKGAWTCLDCGSSMYASAPSECEASS